MINKVVVRYCNGDIIKGNTGDFSPNKDSFHLQEEASGAMKKIDIKDLKAVYFVKSLSGDPVYDENPDGERTGMGRKISVQFNDGETQIGYTQGYAPNRPGFFIVPGDPQSNNERAFVVTAATENVQFL